MEFNIVQSSVNIPSSAHLGMKIIDETWLKLVVGVLQGISIVLGLE